MQNRQGLVCGDRSSWHAPPARDSAGPCRRYTICDLSPRGARLTRGPLLPSGTVVALGVELQPGRHTWVRAEVGAPCAAADGGLAMPVRFVALAPEAEDAIQDCLLGELERYAAVTVPPPGGAL